jgi:hypothetical protein
VAELSNDGDERVRTMASSLLHQMVEEGLLGEVPAPGASTRPLPGRPDLPADDGQGRSFVAYLLPFDTHLQRLSKVAASQAWRWLSARRWRPPVGTNPDSLGGGEHHFDRVAWQTADGVEVVYDIVPASARARLAFLGPGGSEVALSVRGALGLEGEGELLVTLEGAAHEADASGLAPNEVPTAVDRAENAIGLSALWTRAWSATTPDGSDDRIARVRSWMADPDPLLREAGLKAALTVLGWAVFQTDFQGLAASDPDEMVRQLACTAVELVSRLGPND